MPVTNIDHLKQGLLVRIKQDELKGKEPSTWKNNAKLVRFEKDVLLTDMNKRNIVVYRCILQFDGKPTQRDLLKFGRHRCMNASVLPVMIETI